MSKRPRKSVYKTRNRRRVLAEYQAMVAHGEPVRLSELARRCGLYSYREAGRTLRDLKRYGMA